MDRDRKNCGDWVTHFIHCRDAYFKSYDLTFKLGQGEIKKMDGYFRLQKRIWLELEQRMEQWWWF
jgi:hypothetical protein